MTATLDRTDTATLTPAWVPQAFAGLVGSIGVLFVLQGLFAGLFLRYDGQRDGSSGWIDAHALGAHVAFGLSIALAALAVTTLRHRKDLLTGSLALFALITVESYLGGAIRDDGKDSWTSIHVPIAMALMGVVTWLAFRAAAFRRLARNG